MLWSYGLKEETAILGQKNCHGRMVSKRKSSFKVKRIVMVVWSQRGNCRLRSKELTDACVHEAEAVSQGEIHHVRGHRKRESWFFHNHKGL